MAKESLLECSEPMTLLSSVIIDLSSIYDFYPKKLTIAEITKYTPIPSFEFYQR